MNPTSPTQQKLPDFSEGVPASSNPDQRESGTAKQKAPGPGQERTRQLSPEEPHLATRVSAAKDAERGHRDLEEARQQSGDHEIARQPERLWTRTTAKKRQRYEHQLEGNQPGHKTKGPRDDPTDGLAGEPHPIARMVTRGKTKTGQGKNQKDSEG